MNKRERSMLTALATKYRIMQREYIKVALRAGDDGYSGGTPLEKARYEGESIAMRWCAEDLEQFLSKRH